MGSRRRLGGTIRILGLRLLGLVLWMSWIVGQLAMVAGDAAERISSS